MAELIGLRSLRSRVLALCLGLATLPLVGVRVHRWVDTTTQPRVAAEAQAAFEQARPLAGDPAGLARLARERGVRIRTLTADGAVLTEADHDYNDALGQLAGRPAFGQRDFPSLWWLDGQAETVAPAPWLDDVNATGSHTGCLTAFSDELLACRRAEPVGGVVLEVTESSRRAARALHDEEVPLLKLTLMALPTVLLLGWLLARLLVAPAERLVRDVEDRRGQDRPPPLGWERPDEFGRIARAFDGLSDDLQRRRDAHAAGMAELAHELKNPVAALSMASERLQGDAELTPARRARLARVLARSSARLDLLVSRFLDLARAEAGPGVAPRERVELAALVAEIGHDLGADLSIEGQGAVLAEPAALDAAVRNVLDNACHFSPGGVSVQVSADRGQVALRVEDQGPGFPDPARAFERFYTQREGGTGLGLAITKAVVEAHGGRVEARNTAAGAQVVIHLPQAP